MSILEEASELINGQRAQDYGPVCENFERIADFWTTYIGGVEPLTPFDVANMMILVKVARQKTGSAGGLKAAYHRDSALDIAGYAALAERCRNEIHEAMQPLTSFVNAVVDVKPRVWDSLSDVPIVVEVTDADGDTWKHHFSECWQCWDNGDSSPSDYSDPERYSPFTEILSDG